jgi:hypothetical protein
MWMIVNATLCKSEVKSMRCTTIYCHASLATLTLVAAVRAFPDSRADTLNVSTAKRFK